MSKPVHNVGIRDLIGLTAQIPNDNQMIEVKPVVLGFLNEAKAGDLSETRIAEIMHTLEEMTPTKGTAAALRASMVSTTALITMLQCLLDFWDGAKNPAAGASNVKSSPGLSQNRNSEEQAVWDMINRS